MTLSHVDLMAIAERIKRTPGTWQPDSCGAPVVRMGYCENLINMMPKTDLYLRRKKGEDWTDELRKLEKLNEQLKPLFAPAYQAHYDVRVLFEEVGALRERLAKAESLLQRFMGLRVPVHNDTLCWVEGQERLMLDIGDYLEATNEKTPPHP